MVSFIVLPPLQLEPLSANTAVTVFHAGQTLTSPLAAALAQFAKAVVALHPVDAPLHTVILPPLPAGRRDAALRVKLEDSILGDAARLTLAVDTLGKHRFAVACVAAPLLTAVLASLRELGHAGRTVVALTSHLPIDSTRSLGDWTLWRDAQGAGALPLAVNDSANESADHAVNRATDSFDALIGSQLSSKLTPFTATQTHGAMWRRWRWALLLAALCALVYLAGLWLHSRNLLALERQAQRSTAAAFQDALPNTPMVDAVIQLQRAATGGNALSTAMANIPADWPPDMVTQINWASKRLSITASPALLKLNEAQQKTLADTLAGKNIALTWSKP